MCLKDFLEALHERGIEATVSQVRWALATGKMDRPPLDGSLRFVFEEKHVTQLVRLLKAKRARKAAACN